MSAGADASERHISWVTGNASASIVAFGLDGKLDQLASGYNLTYTEGGWLGVIHRVVLSGLKPDSVYSYRVGAGSAVHSFRTWNAEALKSPFSIALVGDMAAGESEWATRNIDWLNNAAQKGSIDAVIHIGDIRSALPLLQVCAELTRAPRCRMCLNRATLTLGLFLAFSYADGYMATWDAFFTELQPTMTAVPYIVVPGNHEIMLNFTAYQHRFFTSGLGAADPSIAAAAAAAAVAGDLKASAGLYQSTPSGTNLWSSWDVGCVHFVGLSSESVQDTALIPDEEMAWLEQDLAATAERMARGHASRDASSTAADECSINAQTFIVLYLHRPLYCSDADSDNCGAGAQSQSVYLQGRIEEIIQKYQIDIVFAGHMSAADTQPQQQQQQ